MPRRIRFRALKNARYLSENWSSFNRLKKSAATDHCSGVKQLTEGVGDLPLSGARELFAQL